MARSNKRKFDGKVYSLYGQSIRYHRDGRHGSDGAVFLSVMK